MIVNCPVGPGNVALPGAMVIPMVVYDLAVMWVLKTRCVLGSIHVVMSEEVVPLIVRSCGAD